MIRKKIAAFIVFLFFGLRIIASNNFTGIDTTFSGSSGTDYQEEYFYGDPLVSDRKVVYIKGGATITLAHNARNVSYAGGGTYQPVSGGNVGTITYKIDRDMQYGRTWGDANGVTDTFNNFGGGTTAVPRINNTSYSAPFTLASLTYDGSTPVVGTTGAVSGQAVTNFPNYYWRGILDSFGDEWHVLTVADNDTAFISDPEGGSSDGRIILMVVNPKSSCFGAAITGNAQFFTTPPKAYFTPKISSQTTYFSAGTGSVTFTLHDIMGGTTRYSINGAAFSAGASTVTLTASDFNSGTNTLDYKNSTNPTVVKRRVMVKDPPFPSAGETHGYLLWGNQANYNLAVARVGGAPYQSAYNNYLGDNFFNPLAAFDTDYNQGKRICYGQFALQNAFVASITGWQTNASGRSKTSALYAKQMILQSQRAIDPVGEEISQSNRSIPTRELFYRGYYDVDVTFSLAFAYDLLIANYKSTQQTNGITPIEDYFIRDELAACAYDGMLQMGNWGWQESPNFGMWGTSRSVATLVVALAMPSYSTSYYGTSGVDGTTTVYPYTPFPDTPLTWRKTFIDNDATLVGYPNLNNRMGVEDYELDASGNFENRVSYLGQTLMGHIFQTCGQMASLWTGKAYPHLDSAQIKMSTGTIIGLQDGLTEQFSCLLVGDSRFSAVALNGIPFGKSLQATDPSNGDSESSSILNGGVFAFSWYDNTYQPSPGRPGTSATLLSTP